jgi:type III secretion protein C
MRSCRYMGTGLLCAMTIAATPLAAQETILSYHVMQVPVRTMAETVLREAGLRGVISPDIKGTLSSRRVSGTAEDILKAIALNGDIDVFRFNDTIYVSAAAEATTRLILLRDIGFENAIAGLAQSGLVIDQYPVTIAAEGQAMAITGPPTYIALIEAVIQSLSQPDVVAERNEPIVIRRGTDLEVIYLKNPQNTPQVTE